MPDTAAPAWHADADAAHASATHAGTPAPTANAASGVPPAHPAARPATGLMALDDARGRWLVWRRRGLILTALLGCVAVFMMVRWMAGLPHIDAQWQRGATADGGAAALVLESSPQPALHALRGHAVLAVRAPGGTALAVDAHLLHRAPRWQADDHARQAQAQQLQGLAQILAQVQGNEPVARRLELRLDTGDWVAAAVTPRGYGGLGLAFWPLVGVALLLYLFAAILLWAKSQPRHLPLVVMSLCQVVNLLCLVQETLPGLVLGVGSGALITAGVFDWSLASHFSGDIRLRLALDLGLGAAAVHAFALHPRPVAHAKPVILLAWSVVPLWLLLTDAAWHAPGPRASAAVATSPALWVWGQVLYIGFSLAGLAIIQRSYRIEANPYARVLRRFAGMGLVCFVAATAIALLATQGPGFAARAANTALVLSLGWNTLVTALLLLIPFMARSPQVFREFATLAGVSTVATSIDLLFVAVFALGPFTSLAAAVFISLALYAALRQRLMNRLIGQRTLTTERTFDHIYRAARAVQAQPQQYMQRLTQLLREVFEPMEVLRLDRVPLTTQVTQGGAALVVPIRQAEGDSSTVGGPANLHANPPTGTPAFALGLRFAQRGQRLFTEDDAKLADRVVEQLRRAVAHDQAVEQGRHEERQRIAQDLHDDIGARLLTLMYQAKTPEMEDYIRHTLQDLKTLTRGLAANDHWLSHACGEWKADITQRLNAAQARLVWTASQDQDLALSMVQWSALTRVLRELISNALYHGHASQVEVEILLHGPRLQLSVADNGSGKEPAAWAHGLGLGGVRKRVKMLGGVVRWSENKTGGIRCDVDVAEFSPRDPGAAAAAGPAA
jgi:signal transduction histidine kinase